MFSKVWNIYVSGKNILNEILVSFLVHKYTTKEKGFLQMNINEILFVDIIDDGIFVNRQSISVVLFSLVFCHIPSLQLTSSIALISSLNLSIIVINS